MKKYYPQISFITIIAVLSVVSLLAYRNLTSYMQEVRLIRHSNLVSTEAEKVLSIVKDAVIGNRGFQLTQDSSFLAPYFSSSESVAKTVGILDSLVANKPAQVQLVDSIEQLVNNQYRLTAQMLVNTKRNGVEMDSWQKGLLIRGNANLDDLRRTVKGLVDEEIRFQKISVGKERYFRSFAPASILLYSLLAILSTAFLFRGIVAALKKRLAAEKELEQKNRSLQASEALLLNVLDSSPNAIMAYKAVRNNQNTIVDFEGIIVNQAGLKSSNMQAKDVIGKSLLATFPHAADDLIEVYKEVVRSGETKNFPEKEFKAFNRWFNITIAKSGDGFVVTSVDITDQKIKEKQLEQSNSDLKRSNEELEQFAYVASHDLQEPLRKIRAFGDLLATEFITTEKGALDYIQRMQKASSRMQALIGDLLSFSRVSQNSSKYELLELNSLLKEVIDDLENQIEREHAVVVIESLPVISGNKLQIKRLFQNLISNAIKFHKAGEPPRITVTATKLSSTQHIVNFQANPDASYWKFEVVDNGIGFDAQYSEKIFTIFQRLHGRMEYEGTGIGLAICKKIVNNHRGYITAQSAKTGSTFIVILPSA